MPRRLGLVGAAAAVIGCAAAPPDRAAPVTAAPPASAPISTTSTTAAATSASAGALSSGIPYASHPDVQKAFKPGTQAALRDWSLELVLFEQDRRVLADERSVLVHGRALPVVQAVPIDAPDVRRRLLGALYEAVAAHGQRSVTGCFEPHHLLIATEGRHRVEVLVCLMCHKLEVSRDGTAVGYTNFTATARPAFEALVGPTRTRAFEGRTLFEWRARLEEAGDVLARDEVATVETAGVLLMGRAAGWGELWADLGLSTLEKLGAAAAPAVPELARLLDSEREVWLRREILKTLAALGPASAPALPAVERLTEDEALGARARVVRDQVRAASGLAPASTAVPFADAARVLAVLPPDLQEVLVEGTLEVSVVQSRAVAAGERAIAGHPVVRSVTVPDREARASLLAQVYEGLEDAFPHPRDARAPFYAVVGQRAGRRIVLLLDDYVDGLEVHVDGVRTARVQLRDTARRTLEGLFPDEEDDR